MDNSESIVTTSAQRIEQAQTWLQSLDLELQSELQAIAGDASFRRYFRARVDGRSRILVDAPPPAEDIGPFIDIAGRIRAADLHSPEIIHAEPENGYLLLEDLGDDLYRDLLDENNVDFHFSNLFDVLKSMALTIDTNGLPEYNAGSLQTELDLFPEWYLGHHRSTMPRRQFDAAWDKFCSRLLASALDQPRCFVHRDFHSSNLLKTADNSVGIIDFQDAVKGPISYDFVSLIWDRYIDWPRARIETWMEVFRQMLGQNTDPQQWQRNCDLMGLQRNFKIVGIFARLYYRDGKHGYIEMIPRFYRYITGTLSLYPEFADILHVMEQEPCVP